MQIVYLRKGKKQLNNVECMILTRMLDSLMAPEVTLKACSAAGWMLDFKITYDLRLCVSHFYGYGTAEKGTEMRSVIASPQPYRR